MKHTFALLSTLLIGSAVALTACGEPAPQQIGLAQEVNPFIGTSGGGNVYPGASAPFGMVQLSPDNGRSGWYRIAGYHYPDTTIAGFSHTHLSGTGAGDMYDISFMPAVPPFKTVPGELGVYSTFSHDDESAQAGYYQVFLPDYGVNVELVASDRCGLQRYTFPQTAQATVFLNLARAMNWDTSLGSEIRVVDNRTIEGYRYSTGWAREQRVYFVARFSAPFTDHAIEELEQRQRDTTPASYPQPKRPFCVRHPHRARGGGLHRHFGGEHGGGAAEFAGRAPSARFR